jgi:hypothetical protein
MTPDEAKEYTQSLGQIVAGSWRQIALAKRLGVPTTLGLEVDEWVRQHLGGYAKMEIADRREAVMQLAADGLSNVEIGEVIGVAEGTIRNDRGASQNCELASEKSNDFNAPSGGPSQNCEDADESRQRESQEIKESLLKIAKDIYDLRNAESRVLKLGQRAGDELIKLRVLVEAAGENWWDWYAQRNLLSRNKTEKLINGAQREKGK